MDDQTLAQIKAYQTPSSVMERLREVKAVILIGITGAGKDTIINDILKDSDHFTRVVTSTTRVPRRNNGVLEQNGRDYYFLSIYEAKDNLKNGEYIEVANVHGRIYGSLVKEYERISKSGHIALTNIDYQGAQAFLDSNMPNLLVLFVVPPSFDVWMERLTGRHGGSLEGEKDEIIARLRSAEKELEHALADSRFIPIMNVVSADSAKEIINYVETGKRPTEAEAAKAHQAVRDLAESISEHIKELEK